MVLAANTDQRSKSFSVNAFVPGIIIDVNNNMDKKEMIGFRIGDSWKLVNELEDGSVDCVVTSPPYWGLRDYGVSGQAGLEEHPQLWVDKMVELCELIRPKLKKGGVMFWNIGETYFGSNSTAGSAINPNSISFKSNQNIAMPSKSIRSGNKVEWQRPSRDAFNEAGISKNCLYCGKEIKTGKGGQFCGRECLNKKGNSFRSQNRTNWLQPKQLLGLPWRFAIAMQEKGWILRNAVVWDKPNHMPSSVKDRFSNGYEYVFMFVKSRKYWFDLDSVREPHQSTYEPFNLRVRDVIAERVASSQYRASEKEVKEYKTKQDEVHKRVGSYDDPLHTVGNNLRGKNCGDVWRITTRPHPFAHFAVFPEELAERCIKAGCPEFVCKSCGKPRERIIQEIQNIPNENYVGVGQKEYEKMRVQNPSDVKRRTLLSMAKEIKPVGWSDCGCNVGWQGGVVLDPFMGSGTVAVVAKRLNRQWVGFELNPKYIKIAEHRLAGVKNWSVIQDIEKGQQTTIK